MQKFVDALNLRIGYGLIDWAGLRHQWRRRRVLRCIVRVGGGKVVLFIGVKASMEGSSWRPQLRWRSSIDPILGRDRSLQFSVARFTAEAIHFLKS
jgi:hypothetical protein